jgi:hypothetical protein
MALIKTDHRLEQVLFTFNANGDVVDVKIQVNFVVRDDVTGLEETRVRKEASIWSLLTPVQQGAVNTFGRRAKDLAAGV